MVLSFPVTHGRSMDLNGPPSPSRRDSIQTGALHRDPTYSLVTPQRVKRRERRRVVCIIHIGGSRAVGIIKQRQAIPDVDCVRLIVTVDKPTVQIGYVHACWVPVGDAHCQVVRQCLHHCPQIQQELILHLPARRSVPGIVGSKPIFIVFARFQNQNRLAEIIGGVNENVLLNRFAVGIGRGRLRSGQRAVIEGIVALAAGVGTELFAARLWWGLAF